MAIAGIDNERKACDAVARSLEDLLKVKRSNAHSPEDDQSGPPVEYVFDLNNQTYAMEHTVVEAFDGQIQTDVHFDTFITPISTALDYNLPVPGAYRLFFQIDPGKGISTKRLPVVQAQIVEWVKRSPEGPGQSKNARGYRATRKGTIEGVEIELSFETGAWMPDATKGRLFPIRVAPPNYESLRLQRLRITMSRKLKKLQDWKKVGARSVLVLENRDLSLSNHVVILEATERALKDRTDQPGRSLAC